MFTKQEKLILIHILDKEEKRYQEYIEETKDNESREIAQDQQFQIGSILKKLND